MNHSGRLAELVSEARLARRLFADRRVPTPLKIVPLLALLYLLSPTDLLPDVIPVLTQVDDLAVIIVAIKLFIRLAPDHVVAEHVGAGAISTRYRVRDP